MRKSKFEAIAGKIAFYSILGLFTAFSAFPFVFALATSFKDPSSTWLGYR